MRRTARAACVAVAIAFLAFTTIPSTLAAHGGGGHAGGGGAHGGGGGAHGGAFHGSASHGVAVRPGAAHASAGHIYAGGTAHWGYGYYGHYHGYPGYPYYPYWGWGWGYPYWSVGFYWGWPYYGYGYPDGGYYDYQSESTPVPATGPAIIVTAVTPSRADVVLDGENVGSAKDYNGRWDRLQVSPGHHTLSFKLDGYRSLEVNIDARAGRTYTFNDVLSPGSGGDTRELSDPAPPAEAKGRLKLNVMPLDTAVYLDGEYLGVGGELSQMHGALSLPLGTHHLEAVRPGYVTVKRTIEVGPTDVAKADVTLEPEH